MKRRKMMNETVILVLSLLTGGLLGVLFFGGLWWTIHKSVYSKYPAFLFLGSLLLRTGIVLLGFYMIARGNWLRLLMSVLGFILLRMVMMHFMRSSQEKQSRQVRWANHAHQP
jgi:F1F0 ATPase subunit 2